MKEARKIKSLRASSPLCLIEYTINFVTYNKKCNMQRWVTLKLANPLSIWQRLWGCVSLGTWHHMCSLSIFRRHKSSQCSWPDPLKPRLLSSVLDSLCRVTAPPWTISPHLKNCHCDLPSLPSWQTLLWNLEMSQESLPHSKPLIWVSHQLDSALPLVLTAILPANILELGSVSWTSSFELDPIKQKATWSELMHCDSKNVVLGFSEELESLPKCEFCPFFCLFLSHHCSFCDFLF